MGEINISGEMPIHYDENTTYALSADGMILAIVRRVPQGFQTSVFKRDEPFTEEALTLALNQAPRVSDKVVPMVGQKNTSRRKVTRFGTFYSHVMTGPPTWWLPKIRREKDGTLMAGWLRLAVAVHFDRSEKKDEATT